MYTKKFEIKYGSVLFIEKATAYYFERADSKEEEEFMKKNQRIINRYLKKYPRFDYEPLEAYQYACEKLSQYTEKERNWIWKVSDAMTKTNADISFDVLNKADAKNRIVYKIGVLINRIKIFFSSLAFAIKWRSIEIVKTLKEKFEKKDNDDINNTDDLII